MEERHDLVAGQEAVGLRLDVWLVQRLPSLSRARLQALIDEGCVLLDGKRTRASARLRSGQRV
ncbi:MAG TPA: S4 domain-containing protein, partial [Vicinamibacteria bacterium]|nr:S4 domain-containing protein [Vicinamibacteria bacterium]